MEICLLKLLGRGEIKQLYMGSDLGLSIKDVVL